MSEKTVAEKLLIKAGTTVWTSDAAQAGLLEPLPEGARLESAPGEAITAVVFARDAASLRGTLDRHKTDLARPANFWVAYPKGNRADINRDTVWPILGDYGMRPIGQVAVDDVWSALRFRPLKEGEERFAGGKS